MQNGDTALYSSDGHSALYCPEGYLALVSLGSHRVRKGEGEEVGNQMALGNPFKTTQALIENIFLEFAPITTKLTQNVSFKRPKVNWNAFSGKEKKSFCAIKSGAINFLLKKLVVNKANKNNFKTGWQLTFLFCSGFKIF